MKKANHFKEASKAERLGNLRQAKSLFLKELSISRSDSVLFNLGSVAFRLKQYKDAIKYFRALLDKDPNNSVVLVTVARSYSALQHYDQAIDLLEHCVSFAPESYIYILLGHDYERIDNIPKALAAYQLAINVDPQNSEAYCNFGRLSNIGDPKKAIRLLKKAVRLNPFYAEGFLELGAALLSVKRIAEAEKSLRKSIKLKSDSLWSHLYLANLLWRSKRLNEAKAEYEIACAIEDSDFVKKCFNDFREKTSM